MNKTWIIFKNTLIDNYNLNKTFLNKDKDPKIVLKKVFTVLGAAFLLIYLMFIMGTYTYMGINYLKTFGIETMIIPLATILVSFTIFTTSIFKAKSTLFSIKDNDILFSMPIKPIQILISKLANLLITNYLMVIITFIPIFLVYGVMLNETILYYINSIILMLFLPIIPTILSAGIGYVIAIISNKFKRKNLIEIIFTFGLFIFFMMIPYFGKGLAAKIVENIDTFIKIIKTVFFPIYCMQMAMLEKNFGYLILFVLINIVLLILFIISLNKLYMRISIKLQENRTTSKYVEKELKKSGINIALLNKEFKNFISTPIYIFNTMFGVVMLVLAALASFIYSSSEILTALEMTDLNATLFPMIFAGIAFIISMSTTSAVSLSLEGPNIELMKSLPVSTKKIFNAKIFLNILLVLPATALSTIIIANKFNIELKQIVLLLIFSSILSVFVAQFGLIINLLFPKFKFKNPTQVVKQSMSAFVGVMGLMCIDFVFIGIYFLLKDKISIELFISLLSTFIFIVVILQNIILNKWGSKKIKSITL